jgi:hypothetical protein
MPTRAIEGDDVAALAGLFAALEATGASDPLPNNTIGTVLDRMRRSSHTDMCLM